MDELSERKESKDNHYYRALSMSKRNTSSCRYVQCWQWAFLPTLRFDTISSGENKYVRFSSGYCTYTTLDPTKTQILVIDYQWLGAGRIRFGFSIDWRVQYCHEILNANIEALPYMSNPNLPIRYEITNDGSWASATLRAICAAVESEGGEQEIGINRTLTRGATSLVTLNDSNLYPLIAFRLRSGYLHSQIQAIKYAISCTSTSLFEYQLIVNPTVTGTAFSYTTLTNSGIEYDVSRTNSTTVSGGDLILDAGLDSVGTVSSVVNTTWKPGSTIAGASDVVVLAVRRLTWTTETFYANLVFNEML
jgi:hypothetical protein